MHGEYPVDLLITRSTSTARKDPGQPPQPIAAASAGTVVLRLVPARANSKTTLDDLNAVDIGQIA
jgi:hypothetical protein